MTSGTARLKAPGPVLLFSSHTDVVPPGEGWTRAPFEPHRDGFRLVGRGANDAKASVASMAVAMRALFENPPERGEVVFAATCEEERGRKGLEAFLPSLGPIDAALVGEPTSLEPAIAQNGLLIMELIAHGKAGHAARPGSAINAISIAAADVERLHALRWEPENAWVGPMTLQVTQIAAGHAHNPCTCSSVWITCASRLWQVFSCRPKRHERSTTRSAPHLPAAATHCVLPKQGHGRSPARLKSNATRWSLHRPRVATSAIACQQGEMARRYAS